MALVRFWVRWLRIVEADGTPRFYKAQGPFETAPLAREHADAGVADAIAKDIRRHAIVVEKATGTLQDALYVAGVGDMCYVPPKPKPKKPPRHGKDERWGLLLGLKICGCEGRSPCHANSPIVKENGSRDF